MAYRPLEPSDGFNDGSFLLPLGDEKAVVTVAPAPKTIKFLTPCLMLFIALLFCSNIATILRLVATERDQGSPSYSTESHTRLRNELIVV